VHTARQLVTSLDCDVILVTSQYSKSSHSETRTGSTIRVDHTIVEHCVKNQLIRLRTLGEEAFGITLPQVKNVNNRHCCSSMGTSGSLELSSTRTNLPTGLSFQLLVPSNAVCYSLYSHFTQLVLSSSDNCPHIQMPAGFVCFTKYLNSLSNVYRHKV